MRKSRKATAKKARLTESPYLSTRSVQFMHARAVFVFLSFCKIWFYVCSVVCHCETICCIFGDLGYPFTDFCSYEGDLGCTFADFSQFGDHLGGAWCHLSRTLADIVGFGVHLVRTSGSPGCPFGDLSGLWHLIGYTCGKSGNAFADLLGFLVELSGDLAFYVHRKPTFRFLCACR